ncbi:class F sortase [Nocardia sp. NPDC023852]|uniref:class F sortase n=1 Tax=Nocardia sp. NPDC023852 TaxID=3154697 RepID=UPI0034102FFE
MKRERRRKKWWALAAVLLLTVMGLFVLISRGQQDSGSPEAASPPVSGPATPSGAAGPEPEFPVPVALRIPSIGVDTSLVTLGLNPDETVEVPTDFQKPGWYKFGPSPGQPGSAVILGHADSFDGPAVFHRLPSLEAGAEIEVSLSDGRTVRFAVTKVETYPKTEFPAQEVYGSHGHSALQLVTCGGEFDHETRSYQSNIVAYTSLTETDPAAAVGAP